MPANPKYLNKNPWQRFAKISCGVLGGYLIAALLHMILAILIPIHKEVLITSIITIFLIWCILMIVPFLFKNGWKAWLYYLITVIFLGVIYYFVQPLNPFVHG